MKIVDTNIIIYAAKDSYLYLRQLLLLPDVRISAISKVETLGYNKLTNDEKQFFESIFNIIPILAVDQQVIDIAVMLKQQRKYSLGDALIAATALLYDAELNTNNMADFDKIAGLKLVNPLI